MDQNSPSYYVETTEQAIKDAERYVQFSVFPCLKPLIFAPFTCLKAV